MNFQQQAMQYLAQGAYHKARELYEEAIEQQPTESYAYWWLGLTLLLQGEEGEAQGVWLMGISQGNPEEMDTRITELITVLAEVAHENFKAGNLALTERLDRQILELNPDYLEAYHRLGAVLSQQNRLEETVACYQQLISLNPHDAVAYYNLGVIFAQQGHPEQAIEYYQQAISREPRYEMAYNNLGVILKKQGKLEEAIRCYQQAIALNPNNGMAFNNLGIALYHLGRLDEASQAYQEAIRLDAGQTMPMVYSNLGAVYEQQGKLEEAIACHQRTLRLDANCAVAYSNLGLVYEQRGQFDQAMTYYEQGLTVDPDCAEVRWNRALMLLRLGKFQEGFAEYEWRMRQEGKQLRYAPHLLWDGSKLDGKTILLHSEQGLGDTIQFVRYAPLVAQRGGRVIIECQKPLVRLLKTLTGVEQVIGEGSLPAPPKFDVHAPLMSLPYIFGTTLETVPYSIPYLSTSTSTPLPNIPPQTKLKVGIVWASGYYTGKPGALQAYQKKSCPLSYFLELLSVSGVSLYSLQVGRDAPDINEYQSESRLVDLNPHLQDFADTSTFVKQLDLVISVDTAVAHLAGAMAKPVWLLLPFVADWRWMNEREDTPWYPTMRLFRQSHPGDWADLFERVTKELQKFLDSL